MSKKGTSQIEQDVFNVLGIFLTGKIAGAVYMQDCRPVDAETEDAVIAIPAGDAEQIQNGRARINIYVKDIDNNSGCLMPAKERLQEIEALADAIEEALNEYLFEEYTFELSKAPETTKAENINQHFVSICIDFKRITF